MSDANVALVDALAQEIRRVDGKHSLGAAALAEALLPFVAAIAQPAEAVDGAECDCPGNGKSDPMLHAPNCPVRTHDAAQGSVAFAYWLAKAMPPGTIIGDPRWWAQKIERMYRHTHPQAAHSPEPKP